MFFAKLLLKRIQSKSPKFYIQLRYISGVIAVICGLGLSFAKVNPFGLPIDTLSQITSYSDHIGMLISGIWGATFTGTTDTSLFHPDDKKLQ